MHLRALGGLSVPDSGFHREKPLLLLCYLLLEGPTPRRHLADLFWPEAARPLSNLSVALSQLRRGVPDALSSDDTWVAARLDSDVARFTSALGRGDVDRAASLYRGPFLAGIAPRAWGVELEEWVYATRERLAMQLQHGLLAEAERTAAAGADTAAPAWAERALAVAGAPAPDPDTLRSLYRLFPSESGPARLLRIQAAELGIDLAGEPRPEQRPAAPAPRRVPPSNLPAAPGNLIGRDLELTELGQMLVRPEVRLLTVTGPGGIGKTRLATQAAADQLAGGPFEAGVHAVSLATIDDHELAPDAIAAAVGVFGGRALADALGGRRLLLLDNLEHLPELWPLLSELLGRCPGLTLLTTSRRRLHLRDEWVLPLGGLALPGSEVPPDEAAYYGAVRLFAERARRARPGFGLDEADLPTVVAICRLLGGSPLGIELAAAWMRALTCEALLGELRASVDLLRDPSRDANPGHTSARAVFEHSWNLLDREGQRALRRLALFPSGFRHDAAAAVAGIDADGLATLIDSSLLALDADGRYRQHPLVREYALERLEDEPDELRELRRRHADHYLDLLLRHGRELRGPEQARTLALLGAEMENIESAWHQALDERQHERLAGTAAALGFLYDVRGEQRRGLAVFSETLARLDPPAAPATAPERFPNEVAELRLHCGDFALRLGQYHEAARLAERSLEQGERLDTVMRARAYQLLGSAAHGMGRHADAVRHTEHALELHSTPADAARIAAILAVMTQALGDFARAEELYRRSIEHYAQSGNRAAVVHTQGNLGSLLLNVGKAAEARELLTESVASADDIAYAGALPLLQHNLAAAHLKLGELDRAERHVRHSIEAARGSGQRAFEHGGLAMLSRIALRRGDTDSAHELALEALERSWQSDDLEGVATALLRLGEAHAERGELEAARIALWSVREHHATRAWVREAASQRLAELGVAPTPPRAGLEELVVRVLSGSDPSG